MEMLRECPATETSDFIKLPDVPHFILKGVQVDSPPMQATESQRLENGLRQAPRNSSARITLDIEENENITARASKETAQKDISSLQSEPVLVPQKPKLQLSHQQNVLPPVPIDAADRRQSYLGRLMPRKSLWPSPQLSIGTKCSRIGDRDCWQAIGPAGELFDRISQDINDLLDTRMEEILKGEPLADNIILYGMYMVGRELETAAPTLIFTCKRPKPRRRAMKYVKQSDILHGFPKIFLAESSSLPEVLGQGHAILLAERVGAVSLEVSRTWAPKRDVSVTISASSTSSSNASLSHSASIGAIVGGVVGGIAVLITIGLAVWFRLFRRRKLFRRAAHSYEAVTPPTWHIINKKPNVTRSFAQPTIEPGQTMYRPSYKPKVVASIPPAMNTNIQPYIPQSFFESTQSPSYDSYEMSNDTSYRNRNRWRQDSQSSLSSDHVRSDEYTPPTSERGDVGDVTGIHAKACDDPDQIPPGQIIQENGHKSPLPSVELPVGTSSDQRIDIRHGPSLVDGLHSNQSSMFASAVSSTKVLSHLMTPGTAIGSEKAAVIECISRGGMLIFSPKSRKYATIGGIVVCNGVPYGVTAQHAIEESLTISSDELVGSPHDSTPSHSNEHDFAFDSDTDEAASEVDVLDTVVTSRASQSSAASASRISSTTSDVSGIARNSFLKPVKTNDKPELDTPNIIPVDPSTLASVSQATEISTFISMSSKTSNDWALVEMSKASVLEAPNFSDHEQSLRVLELPHRIASKPITNMSIIAIKSGINSKGIIYPSSTMIKLRYFTRFQEVWTVRLEEPIVEGDSGSWVIDISTGDFYGHIVAGVPGTGLAFILPAAKTFQEIENMLGPIRFLAEALASDVWEQTS